ncbi:MAG TPA: heavy metal-responsive transcriptional regulator [Dehalococcoidia bacterium]|nr:heavy metal-responsive transcriptional regulator [Dehalococcoidia bacterium]
MDKTWLRIGEVARQAGLSPKAIRFYEAQGLLAPPRRGENSYRLYPPESVLELRFIRRVQGLGLRLAEIKGILERRRRGEVPCGYTEQLLVAKIAELERQMEALLATRDRLRALLAPCDDAGCPPEWEDLRFVCCPVIEGREAADTTMGIEPPLSVV